jgi:integrase
MFCQCNWGGKMKQRADGRWVRVVTVNGKRHSFYSNADTESKADKDIRKQMLDFSGEVKRGELFENVAREWEKTSYEELAYGTVKAYKPAVAGLIERFGGMPCSSITSNDIASYFNGLIKKGYSKKILDRQRSVFNMIMKHGSNENGKKVNLVPKLSIPKNLKPKVSKLMTLKERDTIIANKNNGYWGFFAYFVMTTGCRRGEAFALTYNDVDFDKKLLSIHKTVEHHGNMGVIKDHTKTDSGMREVPLTDDIISTLAEKMTAPSDLIFPDPISGGIITNDRITRGWDQFKKEIGVNSTLHKLRHAYATYLYDANVDLKTAQYLLGHADMQTTYKIYTHLSEERKTHVTDDLRNKLNGIFDR